MSIEYNFPKSFVHRIQKQFGDEANDFLASLKTEAPISLRINPYKYTEQYKNEAAIPWCKEGRYLEKRPDFVFDPLIHAGAYYVQEASSMLFPNAIDFSKDLKVLDLCAAPGGKTTLLLSKLSENSFLVANEIVNKRAQILYENMTKWGNPNVMITNNKTSDLTLFTGYFDVVVVDAPCSGEGMFRKDPKTIREWSETKPFQCSVGQRNILDDAIQLLKHNGLLIYSTCTFSPEENEQIVQWLYKKYHDLIEPFVMEIKPEWGVVSEHIQHFDSKEQQLYKCYPHKIKGEGMFIAVFKSKNNLHSNFSSKSKQIKEFQELSQKELTEVMKFVDLPEAYTIRAFQQKIYALPKAFLPEISIAFRQMNIVKAGVLLGMINFKSKEFIPSHELAMCHFVSEKIPVIDLNKDDAVRYLRKEDLKIELQHASPGWNLAKYKGLSLGWIKNTGKRLNNSYPKEWKIRKQPYL